MAALNGFRYSSHMTGPNLSSPSFSPANLANSSSFSNKSSLMTPDEPDSRPEGALRQRAEQYRSAGRVTKLGASVPMDTQRLVQELELHQIELELQNRELQQARNEAEEAREIYRDLYDFAPVGYFTLSREMNVLMANLTGANLLGVERDSLTGCSFSQWICLNKREEFGQFLSRAFSGKDPLPIELDVLQVGGKSFTADIEVRKSVSDHICRMMVTDVTRRKAEQKAERLKKISTRSNRRLQEDVHHWREVEASLKMARDELTESLEQSEGQQKKLLNLSQALLHAQEEERKRISTELQGRIVQALTAIKHELDLLIL